MFSSRRRRRSSITLPLCGRDLLLAISVLCNLLLIYWWIVAGHRSSALASSPFTVHPLQWHGGHPATTTTTSGGPQQQQQTGSCYCNAADFCMCTPSLAIDLVIQAGNDHLWLVRRRDTGQLAVMGGFVQVGETVEAAVYRELAEEMGLHLEAASRPLVLVGVYSDPRRDARRHTVSVVYAIQVDQESAHPVAADDAKHVERIALSDIESHSFFADHQTILLDFRKSLQERQQQHSGTGVAHGMQKEGFANDVVRSLCASS